MTAGRNCDRHFIKYTAHNAIIPAKGSIIFQVTGAPGNITENPSNYALFGEYIDKTTPVVPETNTENELENLGVLAVDKTVIEPLTTLQINTRQTVLTKAVGIFNQMINTGAGERAVSIGALSYLNSVAEVSDAGFSNDSNAIWYVLNTGIKGVIPVFASRPPAL